MSRIPRRWPRMAVYPRPPCCWLGNTQESSAQQFCRMAYGVWRMKIVEPGGILNPCVCQWRVLCDRCGCWDIPQSDDRVQQCSAGGARAIGPVDCGFLSDCSVSAPRCGGSTKHKIPTNRRIEVAYNRTTCPQRTYGKAEEVKDFGFEGKPAASRRVHPCLHHHPEEAEFGIA